MIQAVIFDFDGVIVDSEPLHYQAVQAVCQRYGVTFSYQRYLDEYIGFDDRDLFRHALGGAVDEAHLRELVAEKGAAFAAIAARGVTPIAGVLDLINHLTDAGVPLAVASGATRRDIELVLGGLGLRDRFGPVIAADDVVRSKPDAQTYALAVQGLALPAGECVAIEDTAAGITAARGAGLWTVGLASSGPATALAAAHRVVDSLTGLTLSTLRQWFD